MAESKLQQLAQKPMTSQQIKADIYLLQFPLVNALFVGDPQKENGEWVLVGAGPAHRGQEILQAAAARFGPNRKPNSIILTHGHFDHVGSLLEVLNQWDVLVYAHQLELPYLTGQEDYPPADPTVSEGLIARISPAFTNKGLNLGSRVKALPADGSIPGMTGWRWIHTPGHTPGHVSLFRESDRVLIVGDAFTTVKQESAEAVLAMEKDLSGPPAYFTTDWRAAEKSVRELRDLQPDLIIPSHGLPMKKEEFAEKLDELVSKFPQIAIPDNAKYVPR